jgi:hypothetical protein
MGILRRNRDQVLSDKEIDEILDEIDPTSKFGPKDWYAIIIEPDAIPRVVGGPVNHASAIFIGAMMAELEPGVRPQDYLVIQEGKSFIHPWDVERGFKLEEAS